MLLLAGSAQAEPRVVEVIGATSDAYDAALVDGTPWIATSGGLVVGNRVLSSKDGLRGARLRSISVLPDGVYLGGVDGLSVVSKDLRVVRTFDLPRVRRVRSFRGARYAGAFGGGLLRLDDEG